LHFKLKSMKLNTITMKKSIQLVTVLIISLFFLISISELNATILSFYTDDYNTPQKLDNELS